MAFLFFAFCLNSYSQIGKYPVGRVLDSIPVSQNTTESFALYLPKTYNPNISSPIVFIFHPAAEGKHGIHWFIKSAEQYNYILVCSNDSRNGPYDANFEVSNRLFGKVFSEFNIDPNRIYTAGFSGGARLASTIAVLTKKIQGVVACGAGFSNYGGHLPGHESFSYAAVIGNEDMNFIEIKKTKGWLDRLGISNETFVHNMGHDWPSQNHILHVFHWLELEADRKGLIDLDNENLNKIYSDFINEATAHEEKGNLVLAYNEYNRMVRNLSGYINLDSIVRKVRNIENNKSYIRQLKLIKHNIKLEQQLQKFYYKKLEKNFLNQKNFDWWSKEINYIKLSLDEPSSEKAKMSKRLLANVGGYAYDLANTVESEYATLYYDICILIYPNYPQAYFKQMAYYSKNNDKILSYLEKLLNNGYRDLKTILNQPVLEHLHGNEKFIQLCERIK